MEFGRSRKHSFFDIIPQLNSCSSQILDDFLNLISKSMIFSIKSELEAYNGSIDSFNGKRKNHIEDEKLSFKTIRNIVSTSSRMIHCTNIRKIFNALEISSLSFIKPIKSILFDKLPNNFKSNLITPFVDLRHTHIIDEDSHLLVARGTILLTHLIITFLLD